MTAVLLSAVTFLPPPAVEPAATVYYGVLQGARKPAEVDASRVFQEIPEYKAIKEKGLGPQDPEYFVLLSKANSKFYGAVARAAMTAACDVVVERGSERFPEAPSDLTRRAIEALEK
jgi:hypothetical protein